MGLYNSMFSRGTITALCYRQEENTIKSDQVKRHGDYIVMERSAASSCGGALQSGCDLVTVKHTCISVTNILIQLEHGNVECNGTATGSFV